MTAFTRRTHIVRIKDKNSDNYIDVEVLDAISFRVENGKEVILNMAASRSQPLIIDNVGGGHGKSPAKPSMRTRVKRIKNGKQMLDIEVVEAAAFRDQRGEEWVLDMVKPGSSFNVSDGAGNPKSTRRVHTEIVSAPFGKKKSEAGTDYITVIRADNIAFRKKRNEEVIISCPSSDDKNAANVTFSRASTFIHSPDNNYDPSDDNSSEPQKLEDSGDPHFYAAFVDEADGFMTGDEKIEMGPFWWIRKIHKPQSGLVWFGWDSKGGFDKDPIETAEAIFNFSQISPSLPNVAILAGGANILSNGTTDVHANVVNPYTDAMVSKYLVWQYEPTQEVSQTKPGTSSDVYITDTANWTMVYNNVIQPRQTPVETREQAMATFLRVFSDPNDPLFGQDPSGLGVTITLNGFPFPFNFPDPAAIAFYNDNGWTFHIEPGSGGAPLYAEHQFGSLVLNIGLIQSLVPDQKEVSFTISVGNSKNAAGLLFVDPRQVGKDPTTHEDFDRTFPNITLDPDPLVSVDLSGAIVDVPKNSGGGTIFVTIRFGEPDPITHVVGPPEVEIDSNIGGGGGGGG